MTRAQPDDDDEAEGDDGEGEAVQRRASQLLPEEARGHSHAHGPEGPLAHAHRDLRLVDSRLPHQRDDRLQRPPGLEALQTVPRRQQLALELRIAVGENAIRRIDDGGIDDGVRVADDAFEHGADPGVALEKCGR